MVTKHVSEKDLGARSTAIYKLDLNIRFTNFSIRSIFFNSKQNGFPSCLRMKRFINWIFSEFEFGILNWRYILLNVFPDNIYLFKVNNRSTRKRSYMKAPERYQRSRSCDFIVNFEHISHLFRMFLLLTLNK